MPMNKTPTSAESPGTSVQSTPTTKRIATKRKLVDEPSEHKDEEIVAKTGKLFH